MRQWSLIMLTIFFVAACGQKGALYKSPEKQDNQVEEQQVEQPQKKQSNKE